MSHFSKRNAQKELKKRQEKFQEEDLKRLLQEKERVTSKVLSQDRLRPYIDDIKLLFSMLKDYAKGNYKNIPWYSISSVGATLLYILTPIDAIPDFIPFFGFVDDLAVLSFCLSLIRKDLQAYKLWKKGKAGNKPPETNKP